MWKSIGKSLGQLQSKCLPHQNQVSNDTVQRPNLAAEKQLSCNTCLEENKTCKCDQSFESFKRVSDIVDDDDEHHGEANNSVTHSVINMTGMLIGLGQLSTPYALETGGWSSTFLMIGLGIICAYCSHLLGKCLDKNPKSRSYTDIGQQAFGTKGKLLAATFIYMEIFMALVSYTISLHDNLIRVFSGIQLRRVPWAKLSKSQFLTLMAVVVALPSLWLRDLSSISFLSFGGVLMSLVIFTSVACTGIFGGVKTNHKIPVLQVHNIPAISGLYIFSYAGHIVFPNLYKAMKDPSKFTKVSIISFSLVTMLYTTLAFMGAKLFGPQVDPQITLSMPPHLIVTKVALWATVLTPMTKYALEFAPMAIQLEHNLPDSMSSRTKLIIRGSVGSILLLVILALALSVPYFEYVLSLTGSLVSIGICVIFPCAFYLKICWGQISNTLMVLNFSLIAFGSLLGVFGTISSSKLLLKHLSKAPLG